MIAKRQQGCDQLAAAFLNLLGNYILDTIEDSAIKEEGGRLGHKGMRQPFAFFAALRELRPMSCFRVNAPLCGIKKISEYQENIFSIFVYILDTIEDGALDEKRDDKGRMCVCK